MILENKIAIVTGASSGLGAAIARKLVKAGAKVYALARNKDKLNDFQAELGENLFPVPIDLKNKAEIISWAKSTFNSEHIPLILVNNAGVSKFDKVDVLENDEWDSMIAVNLNAVHYLTAAIVPFMKETEEYAHIINVGSILGKVSGSEKSAYSASKFAIQGYSEALFKELRGDNIKVTCLNPGSIQTDFFQTSGIIPNERMLNPDELADIVQFVLETPDNVLIDELTVRPLKP